MVVLILIAIGTTTAIPSIIIIITTPATHLPLLLGLLVCFWRTLNPNELWLFCVCLNGLMMMRSQKEMIKIWMSATFCWLDTMFPSCLSACVPLHQFRSFLGQSRDWPLAVNGGRGRGGGWLAVEWSGGWWLALHSLASRKLTFSLKTSKVFALPRGCKCVFFLFGHHILRFVFVVCVFGNLWLDVHFVCDHLIATFVMACRLSLRDHSSLLGEAASLFCFFFLSLSESLGRLTFICPHSRQ